jgi:ubiquinone/menaquinone biosynthesis C-methylase UbiE
MQTDSSHYSAQYIHGGRWASYFAEIRAILDLNPESVLEIGKGDGTVGNYLRNIVPYTVVDHADDLQPDVVADILHLPFEDNSFDVVVACQVLEHLPFEKLPQALKELKRVAKRYVLIDIPQKGSHIRFALKLPLLPYIEFHYVIPVPRKLVHRFHFWEVGAIGYPRKKVREAIREVMPIEKEWSAWPNPKELYYLLSTSDY